MPDWDSHEVRQIFAGLVPDDVAAAYQKLLDADGVAEDAAAAFFDDPDMTQRLTDYGMAKIYAAAPASPVMVDPVEPEMAIRGVLSSIQAQIFELQTLLDAGTKRAFDVRGRYRSDGKGRPDLAVILTDREDIVRISGAIINDARRDFMDLDNGNREVPLAEGNRLTGPGFADSQINHRTIYDQAFMQTEVGREYLEQCAAAGQQVRWRKEVVAKIQIADTSTALVALTRTGMGGALFIHSDTVVRALREYFEFLWETSHPLGSPAPPDGSDPVPPKLRPVIDLLAQGYIKKAIQSKLHMPEKTATRRIHDIYDALGVETLFQAGVAAHRRGWVK